MHTRLPDDLPAVEWVLMTPERADDILLRHNSANRRLNPHRVQRYSEDMLNQRWMWQGTNPVMIDTEGTVLNGQHVLAAIARTEMAQPVLMVTGIPAEVWRIIDNNRPRSLNDELARDGVPHASICAGAVKALWQASENEPIGGRSRTTTPVLYDVWLREHDLIETYVTSARRISDVRRFGSPSILTALMVLGHRADQTRASAFFSLIEHGDPQHPDSAVARLNRYYDNAARQAANSRRGVDSQRHAAMTILAFNHWRLDQDTAYQWRPGREAFPAMLTAKEIKDLTVA